MPRKTPLQQAISPKKPLPALNFIDHILHPLSTEKSIRLMESENTLVFVVRPMATKASIKHAIEKLLGCHVAAVRTFNTHLGEKRAYVQFAGDTPAIDIATNLGVM